MQRTPSTEESFVFADTVLTHNKYVPETERLLCANTEISVENALKVNRQMQRYLNDLSRDLHRMLDTCRSKYEHNVGLLDRMNRVKPENFSRTLYGCGYPFFKKRSGSGPPQSKTYLKRRQAGELFPMDLRDRRTSWLHSDKIHLVQGVKKQALVFLETKNRMAKLRADRMRAGGRSTGAKNGLVEELNSELEPIKEEGHDLSNLRLIQLLAQTEGTDFEINWLSLSMNCLYERHTPNECMGMWYNYLMPSLNRKMWTVEEEDQMLAAVSEYGPQNWTEISLCVKNRSPYQCFVHYQTVYGNKQIQKYVSWTREEDNQLLEYIDKFRIGNIIPWTKIAEMIPSRIRLQVYNRYMYTLNPEIKRSAFTTDEDCILMAAVQEHGYNFREFPTNLLPGRNIRQLRNRYNNVLKHVGKRDHWTEDHDNKLMQLVDELGTSNWLEVSKRISNHSRISCRQRYMTIKKFLDKHPNSSVSDVPRRKKAFSSNVTTENWMETMLSNHAPAAAAKPTEAVQPAAAAGRETSTIIMKTNERALYDYLKYGYNFEWGRRIYGNDGLVENIQIAGELLYAPAVSAALSIHDGPFSAYVTLGSAVEKVPLQPELRAQLIQLSQSEFRFPVNMNTLLGMRGLCIAFEQNKTKRTKVETDVTANERQHEALAMFQRRFSSVLANTAEVAKMNGRLSGIVRLNSDRKRKRPSSTVTSAKVQRPAAMTGAETMVGAKTMAGCAETMTGAVAMDVDSMAGMDESSGLGHNSDAFEPQPSTSGAYYSHEAIDASGDHSQGAFECSPYKIEYQSYASDNEAEATGCTGEPYAMRVVVCDPMRLNESSVDDTLMEVVPKVERFDGNEKNDGK